METNVLYIFCQFLVHLLQGNFDEEIKRNSCEWRSCEVGSFKRQLMRYWSIKIDMKLHGWIPIYHHVIWYNAETLDMYWNEWDKELYNE